MDIYIDKNALPPKKAVAVQFAAGRDDRSDRSFYLMALDDGVKSALKKMINNTLVKLEKIKPPQVRTVRKV